MFNSSEKVSVDLELLIQLVVSFAISSFATLIIFASISPHEFLLQSILSINFMT